MPIRSLAQEEDKAATFPLDNFYAKIKKRPLSILRNVRFGLSAGYGSTSFNHKLDGFGIYQVKGKQPLIFDSKNTKVNYTNWVNNVGIDTAKVKPGSFLVSSDSAKLGFNGSAFNIPFKATIHYEWGGRYRIGAGYSYELMSIGKFHATSYSDKISDFQPSGSSGWMSRYFGIVGVSFYRIGDYLFTGDMQVGKYNLGSNFNTAFVQAGVVYFNLGVTVERELSEYLRLFVRPSYEIKSYDLNLPEGGKSISYGINSIYLNVGVSYRIPDLPKCFIPDCKIQMNHAHGDQEYRSRVHPFYKKQNPQYGQNHPNLIKYKGRNKKKLNSY